jgi:hypothetical protein
MITICETESPKPAWVRPEGALRHAPIGRTTLYDLLKRNVVESSSIGKPGVKRRIRLVNLASYDAWIRDPQAAELRAKNGVEGQ